MVPGADGYMGVLADHEPMISLLLPGDYQVRVSTSRSIAFQTTQGGVIEILKSRVSVLLDSADNPALEKATSS